MRVVPVGVETWEGRCHCSHWIRVVDMSLQASILWEHQSTLSIRCLSDRDCRMLPCERGLPGHESGPLPCAGGCASAVGMRVSTARREKRLPSVSFWLML